MTWDTVNVLTIPWAGETAGKLAGKILDVLEMYRVGTCWVHYPFPCSVLAMYRLGTPPFAPSVWYSVRVQTQTTDAIGTTTPPRLRALPPSEGGPFGRYDTVLLSNRTPSGPRLGGMQC